MGDEVAPQWVVQTQSTLGNIVTKPQLSTKLLSRPPVKFLIDVTASFQQKTKLLTGLFSADDLNPEKVTDRDAKIAFLDKLITFLCHATGSDLTVKSLNIVAGKEPEATNQMLVAMASLTSIPPNSVAAAVARTTGTAPAPAPASAASAQLRNPAPNTPERGRSRGDENAAPAQQQQQQQQQDGVPTAGNARPARPGTAQAARPPPAVRSHETVIEDRNVEIQSVAGVIVEGDKSTRDGGSSGAGGGNGSAAGSSDGGSQQSEMQRLIEQHENATTAARHQQGGKAGKDGGSYLTEAARKQKEAEEVRKRKQDAEESGTNEQGIRIKVQGKGHGSVLGDSEITKLREQLQLLTKASNPLGKYLEAIFDDIDSMTRELDMWRNEARTQSNAASEAQRQTQESLREVTSQLSALDESIKDQRQKVSVVRAAIQRNETTIEKLIRMVINPSERK